MSPCMCGATDCPSCGVAQGYDVVFDVLTRRWVNPEDIPSDEDDEERIDRIAQMRYTPCGVS